VPNRKSRLDGLFVGLWGRHELYVRSLAALLAARGAHARVLADIPPGARSLGGLDVLVVESPLPSELERLAALGPPVVALAERAGPEEELAARRLGASGLLSKSASTAQLALSLERAVREPPEAEVALTPRQQEVLGLIVEGLDNAEIAGRLGISQRTARAHVSSLFERLGVENRTQAAVTALKKGMIGLLLVLALVAALVLPQASSASPDSGLAARIAAAMRAAGGASGAWVADAETGDVLYSLRSGTRRTPASVQKLFTTATALDRFEEGFRLRTAVRVDGAPDPEGVLDGSIYLEGAGDPSLDRGDLARLAAQVRDAGVRKVTGRVYGDEGYFDSRRGPPSTGFRVSAYVGPLSAMGFNRGTLAGFGGGFQLDPPRFAAEQLRSALDSRGVDVERAGRRGDAPDGVPEVASVLSPALAALVRHTNQVSDNYFAEMLLKGVGARFAASGSTSAGAGVVREFQRRLGIGARVTDGSGLARSNAVSPRGVGRLLLRAADSPWFDSFYRSLPLAGHTGTLRKRMRGTAASGRCRAKTGTLAGVSALAGYCNTRPGARVAFALLMNRVNVWAARRAQDRIAAALAARRR
jgi:D-alanyl-D-alanine carboxypeptidase/D-alanyl-D-alanine-endopeptidase (penicillin-binding protein 4)